MIITDYLRSTPDLSWEYARQLGVEKITMRLPDDITFDPTDKRHWQTVMDRYHNYGFQPIVLEPLPNVLHDHIKAGDSQRDESIEKFIQMLPIMKDYGVETVCFNFMAHIGWTRTTKEFPERGGALVTEFDLQKFSPEKSMVTSFSVDETAISEEQLWENYSYFVKAVIPEAEKNGVRLALHPDDPPLSRLGNVSRIMISYDNIEKAVNGIIKSDYLGVTMCQACYHLMGEDLYKIIPQFGKKIFFIHFRNVSGNKTHFHETFHDNGDLDMPRLLKLYDDCNIHVPIRVDHVPTMAGDSQTGMAGYDILGRLYAIGYLKGILETVEKVK